MNATTFFNTLFLMLSEYFPEELNPALKPIDSAGNTTLRNETFDFIIVGAGAAGCVVANRLSANPNWKVLLIEAGGDENWVTDIPALYDQRLTYFQEYIYNYTTVKQRRSCLAMDGYCPYPRGRAMGGTTTINGLVFTRGNPQDYNDWEAMGNPGWNYDNALYYFKKSENMTIPKLQNSPYHSNKGPWTIGYPSYYPALYEDFLKIGTEFGLPLVDYNGERQVGIGIIQYILRGPTRCSISKAYINPIRNRPNLFIFKNTVAIEILFDNGVWKRASGVRCVTNGTEYTVHASKEVIISAGAIDTPKLLMLSGIGPREHLEEIGIPVLLDLPVGKNFKDHPGVLMQFSINQSMLNCCMEFTTEIIEEYARYKKGQLSTFHFPAIIFMNSNNNESSVSNTEFLLGLSAKRFDTDPNPYFIVYVENIDPLSLGSVKLQSSNYHDSPLIDPNYFANPRDMPVVIWAVRQVLKFMNGKSLMKYEPKWMPNVTQYCSSQSMDSDAFIECYIHYRGTPHLHTMGTTRMGPADDKTTVVDPDLKVHGISGLRVIDASVMPNTVRGNTQAAVAMLAEKGADLINCDY